MVYSIKFLFPGEFSAIFQIDFFFFFNDAYTTFPIRTFFSQLLFPFFLFRPFRTKGRRNEGAFPSLNKKQKGSLPRFIHTTQLSLELSGQGCGAGCTGEAGICYNERVRVIWHVTGAQSLPSRSRNELFSSCFTNRWIGGKYFRPILSLFDFISAR